MLEKIAIASNANVQNVACRGHLLMTVGEGSYLVDGNLDFGSARSHILIGRYASLAHRLTFEIGYNHAHEQAASYPFAEKLGAPEPQEDSNHCYEQNHYQIIIGNDVWIGCDVLLMGGVRIGNGAIIGARTVVTKNVPPYAVVVGNPARIVKYRFPKALIERFERIKWWNWDIQKLQARWPEMQDAASFAERYDLPHEAIHDEASDALEKLGREGFHRYLFVADFSESRPLWREVLEAYRERFSAADRVCLVLDISENEAVHPANDFIKKMWREAGADAPKILRRVSRQQPALDVLPFVDTYITGCSGLASRYVDEAEYFGIDVISGCDYGSRLFDRKVKTMTME